MKEKLKITEENYKEVVLKRAIILCWVLLAICFVIKIFGGNFFEIVCTNEKFIKVCEYCDTSFVRYIIYLIYFTFDAFIILKIIYPQLNFKQAKTWVYICLCLVLWVIKVLVENNVLILNNTFMSIATIVYLYLILALVSKRYIFSFLIIGYDAVLSLISSLVKSISLANFITDSMLIISIFMIDYYIMLILTALYSNLKYTKKLKRES